MQISIKMLSKFLWIQYIFLASYSFAEEYQQVWILKNDPQDIAEVLSSHDMPIDLFYQALKKHKIQVIHDTSHLQPLSQKILPQVECEKIATMKDRLLWKDEWTSVYIPAHPRTPHHLWIALNRDKCSFLEASSEELFYLHRTLLKFIDVLDRQFACSQYALALFNELQKDHLENRIIIELLPIKPNAINGLDLMDKMGRNHYMLMRGLAPSFAMSYTSSEIQNLVQTWQLAIGKNKEETYNGFNRTVPVYGLEFNRKAMVAEQLEELYLFLQNAGLALERIINPIELQSHDSMEDTEIKKVNEQCVFCNPKVIANESIYSSRSVRVFYP
ncbi:MAG: hypothetical protein KGZ39_03620 [Simkania sp.]|nr:hypothetical protein [Simkania sp.]